MNYMRAAARERQAEGNKQINKQKQNKTKVQ